MKFNISQPLWMPADEGAGGGEGGAEKVEGAADAGADKGGASFLANADDPAAVDKAIAAPADWPEDWRDKLAGEDKDFRKRLDRVASMADFSKSYREAEKKITGGKKGVVALDEPMPDPEKDPEGLKAWREARGVPATPEDYAIPDTVKDLVTDADKPLIAAFTSSMHQKGISAAAVGPVMEWYFEQQQAGLDETIAKDKELNESLQEELRGEWGSEFRANSTLAKRMGEKLFGDLPWTEARMPDGRRLGDVPAMLRALASAATAEFGDVSFAGEQAASKTVAREAEIREIMRTDFDRYDNDPAMKAEFQQITEAKQKRDAVRR